MAEYRILFRLNADAQIGTGHLMRCLTLANALKLAGGVCCFLCPELSEALAKMVVSQGHQYQVFHSAIEERSILQAFHADWLIVDHYFLDQAWEIQQRPYVGRIFIIDDLADRPHDADILLDQGPLRTVEEYKPLVPEHCKLLLGPDFAMLKPAYRLQQKHSTSSFRKGLICFGGADPAHATQMTMDAILASPLLMQYQWTVVAGAANPDWPDLKAKIAKQPNIQLLHHHDDMATLMAEHDFAIGAAGGMTWERCCIGLPSLVSPIADNQKFNDEVLRYFQLCEQLALNELQAPETIFEKLQQLARFADMYSQKNKAFIDGLGIQRIVAHLLQERTIHEN